MYKEHTSYTGLKELVLSGQVALSVLCLSFAHFTAMCHSKAFVSQVLDTQYIHSKHFPRPMRPFSYVAQCLHGLSVSVSLISGCDTQAVVPGPLFSLPRWNPGPAILFQFLNRQ